MSLMGDITRKVKKKIRFFKINQKLGRYKYIHIMFNDKFNKPFVDFLNKNFDKKEHLILCKRWFDKYPFPDGENVMEIKTFEGLDFHQKNIEKLIFHSLFDEECVDLLYEQKELLNKSYWYIWSGDLYRAVRDEKNDFVRSNFKGYIDKMDEKYAQKIYNIKKDFFDAYTPAPGVDVDTLNSVLVKNKNSKTVIQINHDSDYSTIEMLKKLSFLVNEDIEIRTTLSYGAIQYKDEIIKIGKEIFGNKFKYLDRYLSTYDYVEYINSCDILIMNQNYQQGGANIVLYAYLGKKIFIKNDVSTYSYFSNKGIVIYDTYDIDSYTKYDLLKPNNDDIVINNKKAVNNMIKEETFINGWSSVFND